MTRLEPVVRLALWCTIVLSMPAAGQASAPSPDSLFARARRLVVEGNGAAGRALVDSLLGATREGSGTHADALWWRATLAESSAVARHDYLRLAVEYNWHPRAAEALLRLAQLEVASGDPRAALRHLDRLSRDHPTSSLRAEERYWRGRVLQALAEHARACAAYREAAQMLTPAQAHLRPQLAYHMRACPGDAGRTPAGGRATADTLRPRARAGADTATGRFSVQVAAYRTRADAEALAARLRRRGHAARTVSQEAMHRVRIGRFPTRTEANAARLELQRGGITGFVVEDP